MVSALFDICILLTITRVNDVLMLLPCIFAIVEPGPVSQLVTESISETSVLISWSLPQEQNGIILFYEVSVMGLYTETHNSSVYNIKIDDLSNR